MERKVWKKAMAAAALSLLLLAGAAGCSKRAQEDASSLASSSVEEASLFPVGTTIGGRNIGGKTLEEATDIARKAMDESVGGIEISVTFKDDTVMLQKGDFTIQDVLDLELPKLLLEREPKEYELPYVADLSPAGRQKLEEASKACYVQAKDSSVESYDGDSGTFTFTLEQAGSRVDMAETLKSVRQLLSQKHGGAIQAAFLETKPKITKDFLTQNFKRMSTYSTTSTNTENGNSNMALALSHVNGTVLNPGQEFSYNNTIGDSTDPSCGWLPAGGLSGGVLVQMYGGGICQGSTTLYNAALLAGMEIIERDCHSSPSTYCPIGLDATVDYGNIDFRFRNPLDTPVYISAWMDGIDLYVTFYGCFPKEWDNITVYSEQTGSSGPLGDVSFTVDGALAKGQYVRRSSGNNGYSAEASRTYYKDGEIVRTEPLPSSYYEPTGPIYAIGEGTDTSKIDTSREEGNTEPSPSPTPTNTPTPTPTPTSDPGEDVSSEPSSEAPPTEAPPTFDPVSSEPLESEPDGDGGEE